MVEASGGRIMYGYVKHDETFVLTSNRIDGIDISKIGLEDLRTRVVSATKTGVL